MVEKQVGKRRYGAYYNYEREQLGGALTAPNANETHMIGVSVR
nr:hypothetical protein [uncultured bacterium]